MSWKTEPHSSSQSYDFYKLASSGMEHTSYKNPGGGRRSQEHDGRRQGRRYDGDESPTERYGSKSPSRADLREYLETRKPKSWKRSVGRSMSPPGKKRYDSDDDATKDLHKQLSELKKRHKEYEADLESHPKYQEEWRKFWNRRCDELHHFGVDTDTYDFKPEWLEFWKLRLKELYDEESEPIIKAIREVKEREEDDKSWSSDEPSTVTNPLKAMLRKSPSLALEEISRAKSSRTPLLIQNMGISPDTNDDSLTITSALETITNLEEGLSRIGPKVIDLVGKSLGLIEGMDFDNFDRSKDMPNIKERLNGQLLHNKIQSVQKTFENITTILRGMTSSPNKNKKCTSDDPMSSLNDDVKQWMSIFTDVIENIEEKRVEERHFIHQSPQPSGTEHLTDAEVEALLQNYDTLSEKEKNHLIMFLKNLEKTDEERVKRLKYFFNGQVNRALSAVPDSTDDHRWKDKSRDRSRSPLRSRDRSPKRSRDRSPRMPRDRSRDKSYSRSRDRSPDWSRERSRSREWSPERSRERSRERTRERSYSIEQQRSKRPRTPSPIPEIFDNLHTLYQEQFKDPFYSDVIEAIKQPHWRAPPEVDTFIKFWKGLKIDPESGTLKLNLSGQEVFVIPDRIQRNVVQDFHRRKVGSGQLMCRSRSDTISYVKKYCFIPNYIKVINNVIDKCRFCNQKRKGRKPIVDQSGELFL
ncbi:uncharacterized protein LOC129796530 [Lutzomyia longipalpis]|uniref:uncharacterized protein LOC129796530 n=1 Tax=Lutzomyia longipalpis TaxID=7200 RepID=UPI0024838FBA|nr:uncharacterized protein LOC129796530 [Lutzomyia longipalpis]XP_055694531.1 uncharacterized protein LOC129796530 [Lutzomyia longipalpis]